MSRAQEMMERLTAKPVSKWRTKDGRLLAVPEMTQDHALNLMRFLERGADTLHELWLCEMLPTYCGPVGGEMAEYARDNEWADICSEASLVWLRHQPLYKALRKYTKEQEYLKPTDGEMFP